MSQLLAHDFTHLGVFVYRENCFHIGMRFQHTLQSAVYMTHRLAQVFTAVGSHQNQTMTAGKHFIELLVLKAVAFLHRSLQSVYNSVACYQNLLGADVFLQQVSLAGRGRRKMHIGNRTGQLAVHFLRVRRIFITGTQACFHMAYRNLRIKGSQSTGKGSRGVTMHQHHIGLCFLHNGFQAHQRAGSNIIQGLTCRHNIQIIIRRNTKQIQYLIKHLAMLCGNCHNRLNIFGIFTHCQHQRAHFDSLRTSAENCH